MPETTAPTIAEASLGQEENPGFWYELIKEGPAGVFLDVTVRTLQAYRQRGCGPKYIMISSRCVRYRRIDCREWSEARLRTSTSDPGREAVDMKRGNAPAAGQRVMGGHRGRGR